MGTVLGGESIMRVRYWGSYRLSGYGRGWLLIRKERRNLYEPGFVVIVDKLFGKTLARHRAGTVVIDYE